LSARGGFARHAVSACGFDADSAIDEKVTRPDSALPEVVERGAAYPMGAAEFVDGVRGDFLARMFNKGHVSASENVTVDNFGFAQQINNER
jgi:hypothetical protein